MESPLITIDAKLVQKTRKKRPPMTPSKGPVGEIVPQTPYSNVLNAK